MIQQKLIEVISTGPPNDTTVVWIDTNEDPPVRKMFINGEWTPVESGGGGVSDYSELTGKPKINNVELSGNLSASQLGLATSSLGTKADSAYQKPNTGIPASDLASGVIPDISNCILKSDTAGLVKNDGTIDTSTYLTSHQDIKTLAGVSITGTGDIILSGTLASGENLVFDCGTYTALVRIADTYVFLKDMSSITALSTILGPDDITVKALFVTNPNKYVGLTTAAPTNYSVLFLSGTPVSVSTASGFPSPASSTASKIVLFESDIVDSLTSTDAKAPLSAKQGKTLNDSIGNKANKVSNAINGNFAGLDANGNLTDSGHKHGDYLTSHQSLVGYAKYYLCQDETEYNNIANKDSGTLYLIPES